MLGGEWLGRDGRFDFTEKVHGGWRIDRWDADVFLSLQSLCRMRTEAVHMLYVQVCGGGGLYCSENGVNR